MIDDLGGLLLEECKFCGDDIFCVTDPGVPEEDLVKGLNIFVYFALGTQEKSVIFYFFDVFVSFRRCQQRYIAFNAHMKYCTKDQRNVKGVEISGTVFNTLNAMYVRGVKVPCSMLHAACTPCKVV